MWFRGAAFSRHFCTLLSYFEHNGRIFPCSSAISQHSSTCQNTRVYNIVDFKNIRFQSSGTRIHQTRLIQKIPLWRAVSKLCGFSVRIHWFHVNERPIRKKKTKRSQKCPNSCWFTDQINECCHHNMSAAYFVLAYAAWRYCLAH